MRPRPLLGDKAGLKVQVSRGRFAAFWLDLLLFSGDKAAGGSGSEQSWRAVGHTRLLQYFHSGFQMVPYFGTKTKCKAGLRFSVWVRVARVHPNPSGCSQPAPRRRTRLQDPAFGTKTLQALS